MKNYNFSAWKNVIKLNILLTMCIMFQTKECGPLVPLIKNNLKGLFKEARNQAVGGKKYQELFLKESM